MGFGLLFIGYFMAVFMSMSPLGGYVLRVLGYSLVLYAAYKLKKYNKDFKYLCGGASVMIIISVFIAISGVFEGITNTALFGENVKSIIGHAERVGYLFFTASLCFSIRAIANETAVNKISIAAVRNFAFTVIYFVLYIVAYIPLSFLKDYGKYFGTPVFILYIVIIFMNLHMIFSCYAKICDESDVDMKQKPSRFAVVNHFREEGERRRAEADAKYEKKKREKAERKKNGK